MKKKLLITVALQVIMLLLCCMTGCVSNNTSVAVVPETTTSTDPTETVIRNGYIETDSFTKPSISTNIFGPTEQIIATTPDIIPSGDNNIKSAVDTNPSEVVESSEIDEVNDSQDTISETLTVIDPVFKEVNETVYAKTNVNVRTGPSTDYKIVGKLGLNDEIVRVGSGEKWDKVIYNGTEAYVYSKYLSTTKIETFDIDDYPLFYSDGSCTITIEKKWCYNAWCYIAHLQFSDYERFGSSVAKNQMGSYETTSAAAKRLGAIFCVNGPYMGKEYAVIRNGIVHYDVKIGSDLGIYNSNTGLFFNAAQNGVAGILASDVVDSGAATDTFKFYNSTLVKNGANLANINNYDRAQRTFIATNGNPGDIYIVVSEGRYSDGESPGLRKYECAKVILDLGCTYGVMLDGGGSSTMYFRGRVLNSVAGNQRSVIDFVYFK